MTDVHPAGASKPTFIVRQLARRGIRFSAWLNREDAAAITYDSVRAGFGDGRDNGGLRLLHEEWLVLTADIATLTSQQAERTERRMRGHEAVHSGGGAVSRRGRQDDHALV